MEDKQLLSSIKAAAENYAALKEKKQIISAELKTVNKEFDKCRKETLPDLMEEAGLASINIESVGAVMLRADLYVSVLAMNQTELHAWMEENGFGDLVVPTINAGTLKAWVKERMQNGDDIPEIVRAEPYLMASVK